MHSIDTVWRKKAEKAQHKGRIDEMIDHPPPLSCVLSAALSLFVCLSSLTKQKMLNLPRAVRDPCRSAATCSNKHQIPPFCPQLFSSLDFHCFQKPPPALPLLPDNAESKHFITRSASPLPADVWPCPAAEGVFVFLPCHSQYKQLWQPHSLRSYGKLEGGFWKGLINIDLIQKRMVWMPILARDEQLCSGGWHQPSTRLLSHEHSEFIYIDYKFS